MQVVYLLIEGDSLIWPYENTTIGIQGGKISFIIEPLNLKKLKINETRELRKKGAKMRQFSITKKRFKIVFYFSLNRSHNA